MAPDFKAISFDDNNAREKIPVENNTFIFNSYNTNRVFAFAALYDVSCIALHSYAPCSPNPSLMTPGKLASMQVIYII